jgi:hypothetical protein
MKIKFSMHDSFLDIGRNLLVTEIVDKNFIKHFKNSFLLKYRLIISNQISLIQFKTGQYCCKAKDNSCHHDFTSTF